MALQKFRHAILEAYYDAVLDPFESDSYNLATFLISVNNANVDDFIKTSKLQKDQFYYNKEIKNRLQLIKTDFLFFKSRVDNCFKYWVDTYKLCNGGEVLIARSFFTQKDISWDYDRCTCFIELHSSTVYPCFEKNKGVVVDLPAFTGISIGALTPSAATLNHFAGDPNSYISDDLFDVVATILSKLNCRGYEDFDQLAGFSPLSDFFNWQKINAFQGPYQLTFPYLTYQVSPPPAITMTPIANYVNPGADPYYIAIALRSNLINAGGTPADSFKITFDDIQRMLREVFNVYWVLEPPNFIRFEHYSYFVNSTNYDATTVTNFPFNKFKNKFTYEKDEFPLEEEFNFTNGGQADFIGVPIIYPQCSQGNIVQRGFEKVTTNVTFMSQNTGITDLEGWVLYDLAPVSAGVFIPRVATGAITASSQINGRLSTANLLFDLHRYGRPFPQGIMNNNNTTFFAPIFSKLQNDIIVENCCQVPFNFQDSLVRTELGDGLIIEAEVNYSKDIITFKLKQE